VPLQRSHHAYGWLQVKCRRCETEASIPLDAILRPRDTPICKLEAALKDLQCEPRYLFPRSLPAKLNKEPVHSAPS